MKKKHFVINGAAGKMGRELMFMAQADKRVFAVTGVDPELNMPEENVVNEIRRLSDLHISVIIDFSSPKGMMRALDFAKAKRIPFVTGTTGLTPTQMRAIQAAAKKIPVLRAPNMSIGIAVLRKMLAHVNGLAGFDFQIEEIHHRHKRDKPSGTALMLQKDLEVAIGRKADKPISIRGGGHPGEHRILALGSEELLVLQHTALHRNVFARGALRAAHWIVGKKPGLYTLEDLLK